ncbi:MAG: amidohydrolase family protein [Methyloligellaceae bacterium]
MRRKPFRDEDMNSSKPETSVSRSAERYSSQSKLDDRPPLLPALSCDCHIHILGPEAHYKFSEERQYTPMEALVPDAVNMLSGLGCTRAVIVQPSVYGTNNSCTFNAIEQLPISARAVIVIPADILPGKLQILHEKGARGIRFNGTHWSADNLENQFSAYSKLFESMKGFKWHVECYIGAQTHSVLPRLVEKSQLDLVLDHFGGPMGRDESIENRMSALDQLINTGRIWIKISGYYRLKAGEKDPHTYSLLMEHLITHHAHRLIWGSDWPHTPDRQDRPQTINTRLPFQAIDTYGSLALLLQHIGDQNAVDRIFVKNPEEIYQF